jgi:lysozyme family protein
MDDRFNYAVNVVLHHEGGFSDDSKDSGGPTHFGITPKFLLDINYCTTLENCQYKILCLDIDEAKSIYKQYFWDKYHYDLFESLEIATKVFDMSVNMGALEAHKLFQRAINTISYRRLLVDGILGIRTIHTANNLPASYLHDELRDQSKMFYDELTLKNPNDKRFLKGWEMRASW